METFLLGVGSSLVAAVLAGLAGYLLRGEQFRRRVTAAPVNYIQHLDKLIASAIMEGTQNAVVNARAIVAARNDLRDSLLSLTALMNSEIDTLQRQLNLRPRFGLDFFDVNPFDKDIPGRSDDLARYDAQQLFETIQVLAKKWPSKRDQIKYALDKMIAELGLNRA